MCFFVVVFALIAIHCAYNESILLGKTKCGKLEQMKIDSVNEKKNSQRSSENKANTVICKVCARIDTIFVGNEFDAGKPKKNPTCLFN